jgi:hypothetical protein
MPTVSHCYAAALPGDERTDLETSCYERSSHDGVQAINDSSFASSACTVPESRLSSDAEGLLC